MLPGGGGGKRPSSYETAVSTGNNGTLTRAEVEEQNQVQLLHFQWEQMNQEHLEFYNKLTCGSHCNSKVCNSFPYKFRLRRRHLGTLAESSL